MGKFTIFCHQQCVWLHTLSCQRRSKTVDQWNFLFCNLFRLFFFKLGELSSRSLPPTRILTRLLEVSDDPQVIAVAAHDIGEYVRHYPRGKR